MPIGIMQPGKLLQIIWSLYGLKKIPRNFCHHIKSNIWYAGFKSMDEVYPCLFISYNISFLVYVDDISFLSPE